MTDTAIARPLRGRDGLGLAAIQWGGTSAHPVLLLHGGGQTKRSWASSARSFAESGLSAFTLDLRGHGESEWDPAGDYTLDAYVEDVRLVCQQIGGAPILVGASLGGLAALTAIGESIGPLGHALVLVDVAPRVEESGAGRINDFMRAKMTEGFASLDEVVAAVMSYNPHRVRPPNPASMKHNVRQRADGRWVWHWDPRIMEQDESAVRRASFATERLEAASRRLTVPTLIVRGRMSDLLSVEGVEAFRACVPHAQFVDVEGAGHMVVGDRNDAFNDAVTTFVDSIT